MFDITPFFITLGVLGVFIIIELFIVVKYKRVIKNSYPDLYKNIGDISLAELYRRSYKNFAKGDDELRLCETYRSRVFIMQVLILLNIVAILVIIFRQTF